MIIRITNNDDFQIIFEVKDRSALKTAIQAAWQKMTVLRPNHFPHSMDIQAKLMLYPDSCDSGCLDVNEWREQLNNQAIQCRRIVPRTMAIQVFNQHAYGDSYSAAEALQGERAGRPPEPWIIAGGYPATQEVEKADPGTELSVTRNSNNLEMIMSKMEQADKHAAFLVTINRLRKRALNNEI